VRIWDAETLDEKETILVGDFVRDLCVSCDNQRLAVAHNGDLFPARGHGLSIFTLPQKNCLFTASGCPSVCQFFSDGRTILLLQDEVLLLDAENGAVLRKAPNSGSIPKCACVDNEGTLVAMVAEGGLFFWDLRKDSLKRVPLSDLSALTRCQLSPDGRFCVVLSAHGWAYLVDVRQFTTACTWYAGDPLTACAFHPNSRALALGSKHGREIIVQIQSQPP